MKVANYQVVTREFPDEITLALNISNCPNRCEGCHSPQLREDIGEVLDKRKLHELIEANPGITCVGFMGGDGREEELMELAFEIKSNFSNLKVGWYLGCDSFSVDVIPFFDYIKFGRYDAKYGPLDSPTTNQSMVLIHHPTTCYDKYSIDGCQLEDITYKFRETLAK